MAEFGIATGVLQVAGFGAALGSTLWKCAKQIHNANKELEAIAGEVDAISRSLDSVGILLKDPQTKALHTAKLFDDTRAVSEGCHEVFIELDASVRKFGTKPTTGRYQLRVVARLRWPLSIGRLTELQKVLEQYRAVLHLMLSVMQLIESRKAATGEQLLALEAQLQGLVISNRTLSDSNKDLSHSNQMLVDTVAAITQNTVPIPAVATIVAPASPQLSRALSPFSKGLTVTELSQPPTQPCSIAARQYEATVSPAMILSSQGNDVATKDQLNNGLAMKDHLERCLSAVRELTGTIVNSLEVWRGQTKDNASDIHAAFAALANYISGVPTEFQCKACARRIRWSDAGHNHRKPVAADTCTCYATWDPSLWTACEMKTPSVQHYSVSENVTNNDPDSDPGLMSRLHTLGCQDSDNSDDQVERLSARHERLLNRRLGSRVFKRSHWACDEGGAPGAEATSDIDMGATDDQDFAGGVRRLRRRTKPLGGVQEVFEDVADCDLGTPSDSHRNLVRRGSKVPEGLHNHNAESESSETRLPAKTDLDQIEDHESRDLPRCPVAAHIYPSNPAALRNADLSLPLQDSSHLDNFDFDSFIRDNPYLSEADLLRTPDSGSQSLDTGVAVPSPSDGLPSADAQHNKLIKGGRKRHARLSSMNQERARRMRQEAPVEQELHGAKRIRANLEPEAIPFGALGEAGLTNSPTLQTEREPSNMSPERRALECSGVRNLFSRWFAGDVGVVLAFDL